MQRNEQHHSLLFQFLMDLRFLIIDIGWTPRLLIDIIENSVAFLPLAQCIAAVHAAAAVFAPTTGGISGCNLQFLKALTIMGPARHKSLAQVLSSFKPAFGPLSLG
mmetsp:Transcript_22960/g.34824  ORF Transcript_22960/g.34824 Transcript_22960/m.34824 type:complete len:106 (-) Transcript_22960:1327-1644(-)